MLGAFSDLPKVLRVVSLSTGGAFILFLYAIIQFILPTKSLMLRIGLSFLMGGIIGNVTDRIVWGYVVDFIIFGFYPRYSPAFNLADALQWVGYFLVVGAFIKEGKHLFPAENLRKSYWINPKFQLKYCILLMLCGFGLSIVAGTFSYTYLSVTLHEIQGASGNAQQFLRPYLITFMMVSASFAGTLFVIGLILSHRAAGPLYAFERFLNDSLNGKNTKLKLRSGDEFRELEKLAEKIDLSLRSSRSKSG
jgi:signal peptidase II